MFCVILVMFDRFSSFFSSRTCCTTSNRNLWCSAKLDSRPACSRTRTRLRCPGCARSFGAPPNPSATRSWAAGGPRASCRPSESATRTARRARALCAWTLSRPSSRRAAAESTLRVNRDMHAHDHIYNMSRIPYIIYISHIISLSI